MSTFTRQTHPTSWIGYNAAPTKPTPVRLTADGAVEQKPVRPEVYVREFTSIKVKEIKVSDREGRGGTRSVSVTFDAASSETGSDKKLKHDFSGSTQAGTDVHNALTYAHEQGLPMYVAIETRRRYKSKGGEVIPYTVPMHVLRGSAPDGTSANSNITGQNCANVIAVVGPAADPSTNIISAEAATNPAEWDQFRHNRDGSTPPQGWVRVFTAEGAAGGAIVEGEPPAAAAGAGAGGGVDAQQVADLVVAKMLGQSPDRPVQRLRSVEGKQWETTNLDGRLNPASYVVQSIRWARKDAVELVSSAAYAESDLAADLGDARLARAATELIKPLMWAADRVQNTAVGYKRQAEPSWREAAKWVAQVASAEQPYSLAFIEDREAGSEWIKSVAAAAGDLYVLALEIASGIVGAPIGDGPEGDQHATEQAPQPQQAPQGAPQSTSGQQALQQAQETPQEAQEPQSQQVTMAEVPELVARWDALIEHIGMAQHVNQLNPILAKTFGTYLSSQIPADAFAGHLQQWESNSNQFFELAKRAAQSTAA